jgi:hypothetical protein
MVVGVLSPVVISMLTQSKWSARTKSLVALAFYVVAAAVTAYFSGVFNTSGIVTAIMVVFLSGHAAFSAGWKPTGAIAKVEAATSIPARSTGGRHRA